MKTIIVTLYDDNMRAVGEVCRGSLKKFFGGQPGFETRVFESLIDPALAPSWNKVLAVRSVLADADWVWWLDADCVVHREADWADFTNTAGDLRPSQDYNGINCGVFLMRNSEWSRRFLDTLLFLGDVANDQTFGRHDGCKWEQNAVKALQHAFKTVGERIDPLPHVIVSNTTTGFRVDSFIHHAYAMGNTDRLALLSGIHETSRAPGKVAGRIAQITKLAEHTIDVSLLPERPTVLDVGCRGFSFGDAIRGLRPSAAVHELDIDNLNTTRPYRRAGIAHVDGRASCSRCLGPSSRHVVRGDEVPLHTLKSYSLSAGVDRWDIIKLDCEGSEYEILKSFDRPWAKQLSVEFHQHKPCRRDWTEIDAIIAHLGQWYEVAQHEIEDRNGYGNNYWDTLLIAK